VKIQLNHLKFIAFLITSLIVSTLYFFEIPLIKKFTLGLEDSKFEARRLLKASPQPDKRVIVAAIDEKMAAKTALAKTFVRGISDIKSVLTAEQTEKMKDIYWQAKYQK